MSRNTNRMGLPDEAGAAEQAASPATAVQASHPDQGQFNWSVPTEFVTLPSEGIFYPPTHPLHNQTALEIRYMTAKDEDILTSRSLLKAGLAVDRMLDNVIVDKRVQVDDLLIGDKTALIVAARRTGYGDDYETNVTCPVCARSSDYSFDISEPPASDFRTAMQEYEVEQTKNGTFLITLPMTQGRVECRFMTGADEREMFKEAERKMKKKIDASSTTDLFRRYIVSINGEDNPLSIQGYVQAMPARDARALRRIYSEIIPKLEMTQHFVCDNCEYEADMEVPLGSDFLWPE